MRKARFVLPWALPAAALAFAAVLACFPGGAQEGSEKLDPSGRLYKLVLELREFRTDGPGPPLAGRRVIRFNEPFTEPQEVVVTDVDGKAQVVSSSYVIHVAAESPHGRSFYLLPALPEGSLLLVHPDYPPANDTIPVRVQFDPAETAYDAATVQTGTMLTAQSASANGASSVTVALQRRNLHSAGAATFVGTLVQGATTSMRAAFARPASSGATVVMDTELVRFVLDLDVVDPGVAVTASRLRGAIRGVVLLLSPASGEAYLPVSGGTLAPGTFERYYLELEGTATSGGVTDSWSGRFLLGTSEVATGLGLSAGTLRLSVPMAEPATISTTDAAVTSFEVTAALQPSLDPLAAMVRETRSVQVGSAGTDSVVVAAPLDRNVYLIRGERADGTVWVRRVEDPVAGAITVDPEVVLEMFTARARVSHREVELDWRLAPEVRNKVAVDLTTAAVSRFWTPYFVDSTGTRYFGAYTFLTTSKSGGVDPNVTVTFTGAAGAAIVETSAVANPAGGWLVAQGASAPREGDIEPAEIAGIRLPEGSDWVTVVSRTLQDRAGARLTTADSWNERGFAPFRKAAFSSGERSFVVGWEWEP